ncbi:hypothetical protein CO659_21265 [Rhizobium sp. S9]|uniref:hypothetical protein n=1 Tax=unclassified Rhizobium TaxID=2613769 RepID=UPI000A210D16|nr:MULTISPECIES: hypothetical protein [unclassified Rhizobium]ARO22980.1 hypothetical protein TAL182_CH01167 [Rhizobium sp. TAL182]PDS95833.1 hypothetical protein CO659_21265 [Rhizobium sp. S9]
MEQEEMSKDIMEILSPVLGQELAAAIIEHRSRTLKKPLTAYAARIQLKEYLKTGNPVDAAEMQILRGWRAIKSDWYFNEKAREAGSSDASVGRRTTVDAARDFLSGQDHGGDAFGFSGIRRH